MEIVGDLEQFLADSWHDIANLVRESAVYIDHAATECLHWHTSGNVYSFLKDAGAVSVYELAMYNFRVCKSTIFLSHTCRIVEFIMTCPVTVRESAKLQEGYYYFNLH